MLILVLICWITNACEENINVELPAYEPKLVVEGWIEQDKYARVILTESAAFFDKIDSAALRNSIVTTAKVTVSNGDETEILTLNKEDEFFPSYVYQSTQIKGKVGETYELKVEVGGEEYAARTSVTAPASLDSIWFERLADQDSVGEVRLRYTDPVAERNQYRIFTKRLNKDKSFVPVYLSVIDDRSFNGETIDFSLLRGSESLSEVTDDIYFHTGDTVMIKFCTMDETHYQYWKNLENELYAAKNPLYASGNEVVGNIEGNALGVWGGYGASYYWFVAE
ncbi:DUF4249 domain-containing protein [Porifericola rhodea]|uniref:DUF4249 domain-containing protein n=1 Tax=Porifericola rhodea TaxID=930972 RepID=UPI0026659EB2|nr:DUF4249 domain-containing protein [Porifericola rhodea]WKN31565.1 DUF4249 domain-containing protein [Porifericola rhodea]